ncbi:MAG: ribosome small subunit-dependent GTPase A [Eubacteriales bacterium]|nr:ribosome small subunit-dependent GTPase A [Eubacteriales bacterium]
MTETSALEGVIIKGVGGLYYARDKAGEVHVLRAKGKFRKQHVTPMVGDSIHFTPASGDEHGWVDEILPRISELIRPPVANVWGIFLVIAPEPAPDFLLMDTLLVMARKQGIEPFLLVNKCDLDETVAAVAMREYAAAGMQVLAVSAVTGQGMDELRMLMKKGICCFAGQSGVGKSTLVSAATGLDLKTGEISEKISRGKHTTRHVELLHTDEFQVLDTPGFSLLELWEGMEPIELKSYYPDFAPYEGQCRFAPCYHLSEPGCAVLAAAAEGKLGAERLQRYHQLLKRAQEAWKNRYD